ncbi:hypothetical protein ACH4T9_05840 [Micromonospora sp. NPDC020750]|uniref:hypothetical protein n=1 Tax=unclassified Micromonospora TaxID=2617518 RepID=UPI00379C3AB4
MPDPVAVTDRRESRLLPVLFWTGVAFAPVAALILLVADGNGPLRFAAVLAVTAVVLIGLSIALRTDGGGSRAEIEALYDDIEELRRELRGEIAAAGQRGNQALDASQGAQDQVAALRRRLDAVATAAAPEPSAERPAGAGRARVPLAEAYDDARRPQDIDEAHSGRVRVPGTAHDDEPPVRRPRPTPRSGAERPVQPGGPGPAPRPAEPDARSSGPGAPEPAARPIAPEPTPRPVGLVRHTETVHVTTRHTVVDGPEPGMGLYGAGPAGRWPSTPQERPWASAVAPEPEDHWAGHADSSARTRPEPPDDRSRPPQPTERHALGRSAARAAPAWPVPGEEPAWPVSRDEPGRTALRDEALRGAASRDGAAWAGRPDDAGGAGQYGDAGRVGRYDYADRSDHHDGRGHADGPDWGRPADGPGWGDHVDEPGRAGRADESGGMRAGVPDGARPADRGSWDAPGWSAGAGRARPYQPEPAPAGPGQWSELRAGDRWAEVHDDERGREVRVGERRATAHADGSGYRVEDRWASVRRSEPRPGRSQGEQRWDEDPGGRRPDPERTGRHQNADGEWSGHPPRDDPPRAGGARSADRRP